MDESPKMIVLLADDEAHIRLMLKTVMKSMGASMVHEAKNGSEAVEIFRKERPTVSLLDINMPVKTGLEALQEIRKEQPDALVIMLTSVADTQTVEQCIACGASGYILKDTPIQEMKALIREAWDEYQTNKG